MHLLRCSRLFIVPDLCLCSRFLCQICSLPGFCGIADGLVKFPRTNRMWESRQSTLSQRLERNRRLETKSGHVSNPISSASRRRSLIRSNTPQDAPRPTATYQYNTNTKMTTRRKYTPLSSPSNAGDRREGAPDIAARRGTNSAHKVKVDDSYLYYPSDKTPPASSRYRPPSFDFDTYSPPDLLATSFSSSDGSPEPNAKENRSEHRSKLLPSKGRSKSRGRERRADTNVSKGAVILRQQLLLDQHSPPQTSSSTRGMRDPSPSPHAAVDSSTIHKPVQSNDMLLDIQDLEEQMNSIRAHLHGPDYLRESPRAAKSPSNRNKRSSDRHRSRSRLRGQHRRSKSGSSQNFDYSDLYQLPQISTADSKLDMVIQTDVPAPYDEPSAAVVDGEEKESRVVPLDPPAEGQDNLESFDLGVDTAKSSSSDLLNALPSPQQTHATQNTSLSYETSVTSPSEGARTRSTPFAAGVCTPRSISISH